MGYPDYPKNRLIVNGVDLTEKFKMVLVDGYTLEPPEPKTYIVEIPGGNGKLDLTETLLGDTAFNNRKQSFQFCIIGTTDFEKVKTSVSNFLHGKDYDYKITMDPNYTYHGRFKVTEYQHDSYSLGVVGVINIEVDSRPFKLKDKQVVRVDAIGGKIMYIESGRMRVRPVIETDGFVKIIYNNKLIVLQQGSWALNDLYFTAGQNEIYFNSYDIRNILWSDLKTNNITWGDFKKRRLFEWYKSNGDSTYILLSWLDLSSDTWSSIEDKTWADMTYKSEQTSVIRDIYVKYDWGDL